LNETGPTCCLRLLLEHAGQNNFGVLIVGKKHCILSRCYCSAESSSFGSMGLSIRSKLSARTANVEGERLRTHPNRLRAQKVAMSSGTWRMLQPPPVEANKALVHKYRAHAEVSPQTTCAHTDMVDFENRTETRLRKTGRVAFDWTRIAKTKILRERTSNEF
jgi:hypothetical protein